MGIKTTAPRISRSATSPRPAPVSAREHLVTVVCGLWMTAGLFLDGYFHERLDGQTESFLTPWHAVFYSGFAACALWLWSMAQRRRTGGALWRALPPGYQAAGVGIVMFAAGGAGDAAWHTAFGVERGIDALLSPTHLLLFAGLFLVLTAPVRAGRTSDSPPGGWIVVASLTTGAALVGFFVNFVWGLGTAAYTRVAYDPITDAGDEAVIAGVASTLVTTAVLFGAGRFLLGPQRVPRGAFTVLFGTVALLVSVAFDEDAEGVAAAVGAGITLDLCLAAASDAGARRAVPASFAVASAVLWLVYLSLLAGLNGIEWQAELWVGTVVLNALAAYAIAALPAQPFTEGATS